MLTVGTVCSGIGAPEMAFKPLGWKYAFMSEIEDFPRAVLKYRFPETPLHGDFTTIQRGDYADIDVLVGGTPCQSFSVAGLRKGLSSDNGNLALEFIKLLGRLRPAWFLWENVPGVLSSNGGADFASILGGFTGKLITMPEGGWKDSGIIQGIDAAYSVSWRTIDAQYAGVAQRRRRVFVVGSLGADWRRAMSVLFERHSLLGDNPTRKEKGQGASIGFDTSSPGDGPVSVSPTLDARCKDGPVRNQVGLAVVGFSQFSGSHHPLHEAEGGDCGGGSEALIVMATGQGGADSEGDLSPSLTCNHEAPILFDTAVSGGWPPETAPTLDCSYADKYGYDNQHIDGGAGLFVPIAIKTSDTGSNGSNFNEDGVAYTIDTTNGQAIMQPMIAFGVDEECNANEELFGPLLRGGQGGTRQAVVQVPEEPLNFQTSQSGMRLNATIGTLDANYGGRRHNGVMLGASVRRLSTRECARLQGFPDNHTEIPVDWSRKKAWLSEKKLAKLEEQSFLAGRSLDEELGILARRQGVTIEEYIKYGELPDGPQYKAYGNSMAVPVIAWIGRRIQMVHELLLKQ